MSADPGDVEAAAGGKLASEEAQVLLGRRDAAAHSHDEVEVGGEVDDALLREPEAALDVAYVVALQLRNDAPRAHPRGELPHHRKRIQEDVLAEVERPGVEGRHLRTALERLGPLLRRHSHRAARARLHDHVAASADRPDRLFEERTVLGGRPVVLAYVQVDDGGAGRGALRGFLPELLGRDGEIRRLRAGGLRAADGRREDGRLFLHGAGKLPPSRPRLQTPLSDSREAERARWTTWSVVRA